MAYIESYLTREATKYDITEFYDIYEAIPNADLCKILAALHTELNHWFATLNSDIHTSYDENGNKMYSGGYFHAQDSRDLLQVFDILDHLKSKLHETPYEFVLKSDEYDAAIRRCKRFVVNRSGSTIPEGFKPIEIEDIEPIFFIKNSIALKQASHTIHAELKFIGEGSYAQVFCYKDPTYHTHVALKRALTSLDNKEISRFHQEFDVLKSLHSPYIVQVYAYDDNTNSYTMEYMDESIYDFIKRFNSRLTLSKRKRIISQICHGLEYMHRKGILHRDISLTNVFIKHYEDVDVCKIGDFGLVKMPQSNLTSTYSE